MSVAEGETEGGLVSRPETSILNPEVGGQVCVLEKNLPSTFPRCEQIPQSGWTVSLLMAAQLKTSKSISSLCSAVYEIKVPLPCVIAGDVNGTRKADKLIEFCAFLKGGQSTRRNRRYMKQPSKILSYWYLIMYACVCVYCC